MVKKHKMRKAAAAAAAKAAAQAAPAAAGDDNSNSSCSSSGGGGGGGGCNSSQKKKKTSEESSQNKQDLRAIYSNMQNLMSLAENLQSLPSGTRKSQASSGAGSSASDSSDSDDAPDKLPAAGGRGTGLQQKLDRPVAELLSTPKYSRGEKKARRLLMKLDLEPIANVSRVTMRKAKNVLLCIDQPEVFKCPHTKTIICFGEVRIENTSNAAAAQAAERYINDVNVRAPALSKERDQVLGGNDEEEIDVAALASELDEKDIELVQMQAGCTRQTAVKALIKHKSDVVNAIMELTVGVDI